MTPFNLNYFLRGPSPNTTMMVGLRHSIYEFWGRGDTVQSLAGTVNVLSSDVSQIYPPSSSQ